MREEKGVRLRRKPAAQRWFYKYVAVLFAVGVAATCATTTPRQTGTVEGIQIRMDAGVGGETPLPAAPPVAPPTTADTPPTVADVAPPGPDLGVADPQQAAPVKRGWSWWNPLNIFRILNPFSWFWGKKSSTPATATGEPPKKRNFFQKLGGCAVGTVKNTVKGTVFTVVTVGAGLATWWLWDHFYLNWFLKYTGINWAWKKITGKSLLKEEPIPVIPVDDATNDDVKAEGDVAAVRRVSRPGRMTGSSRTSAYGGRWRSAAGGSGSRTQFSVDDEDKGGSRLLGIGIAMVCIALIGALAYFGYNNYCAKNTANHFDDDDYEKGQDDKEYDNEFDYSEHYYENEYDGALDEGYDYVEEKPLVSVR